MSQPWRVIVSGIAGFLLLVAVLVVSGIDLGPAAAVGVVLAAQWAVGAYSWVLIRGSRPIDAVELLGMGIALGTVLSLVGGVVLMIWLPLPAACATPAVLLLAVWAVRRMRGTDAPVRITTAGSTFIAASIGVVLGLVALVPNLTNYPLAWSGVWNRYHPDMVFFEALSRSIAQFGPGGSIFQSGAEVRYHWFAYGWIGQVSDIAGLAPFAGLTRVLPVVAVVGSVALAASWARRMSKVSWVPTLAVLLVVSGGYVGAVYGTLLNVDSPSQGLTTAWLLAVSFTFVEYVRGRLSNAALVAVGVLSAACLGGKVSAAAVVVAGFGVASIVGTIRREPWARRAWAATAVAVVSVAVTYVVILLGGASSGDLLTLRLDHRASTVQGLDLSDARWGIAAGTLVLALAVVPRWAGLAILVADRRWRWSVETWLGVGVGVSALAALAVLAHGVNDLWFCLSASTPLAVLSAVGVGRGVRSVGPRGSTMGVRSVPAPVLVAVAIGLVGFVAVALNWTLGSSQTVSSRWLGPVLLVMGTGAVSLGLARAGRMRRRYAYRVLVLWVVMLVSSSVFARAQALAGYEVAPQAARPAVDRTEVQQADADGSPSAGSQPAVPEPSPSEFTGWGDGDRDAAAFLSEEMGPDDVVATNLTAESIVPALTGRQMYIAGAIYQAYIGRPPTVALIPDRVALSREMAVAPTPGVVDGLCREGVDFYWLSLLDGVSSPDLRNADVVFQNEAVVVMRLDCGG